MSVQPTLHRQQHELARAAQQVAFLENDATHSPGIPAFDARLASEGLAPLRSGEVEIFQVNLGKMCNQTCRHCHVDAGPDRREIMTRFTMEQCVEAVRRSRVRTVDLTGGAPELNPHFRWFVEALAPHVDTLMVRCNLTILLANPRFYDLPEFFAQHRIEVVSSLPFYTADRTDRQRGDGVFDTSIRALKMLNTVGYGAPDTDLKLHLVYNPAGAFLPGPQHQLERDFRQALETEHGIRFNDLYVITNMPISRFLEFLQRSGNYQRYMQRLVSAFNPAAVSGLMCRNTISVGWDGKLYDCDFNQMLELEVAASRPRHVAEFTAEGFADRPICTGRHCYGCTAGAGSSCGGQLVEAE